MERIPEPELMDGAAQAQAYAAADFSEPHTHFITLFRERFGNTQSGTVLDLGCGPGDITRRFAAAFPDCLLHGIDGSEAMLELARDAAGDRVRYYQGYLPDSPLPEHHYDILISNSLLHHLADPGVLWQSIRRFCKPGATVFIMDLMRPDSREQALQLQDQYAAGEPEVLREDFFNSLLAAYRAGEVRAQLRDQGLENLHTEVVSDRHFIVYGRA